MSNRGADYPEKVIAALPKRLQVFMAERVLEGFKFTCGPLTSAGNRWWSTVTPEGKKLGSAAGGLNLEAVLIRLERWIKNDEMQSIARIKRNGVLAKEREAKAAQLDHGARAQTGSVGLHRTS